MDPILERFLIRQFEEATKISEESDLVRLTPVEGNPPQRYVLELHCKTLVRREGCVVECNRSLVGISMMDDYLRHVDPAQILTWLHPADAFGPNVRPPFICIGLVKPGTRLVELVYRVFDVASLQDRSVSEHDSLNRDAAQWCRQNPDRLPVDRRPLKRRALNLKIEHAGKVETP